MRKRKYTDKEFIEAVTTSRSIKQVLEKLGLKQAGGNYKIAQTRMKKLGVSLCPGSNGQRWSKGKILGPKKPIECYLIENSNYQSFKLKNRILSEGIKLRQCENCNLTEWNDKPIPLELDHINGISTDNRLENLRIICPNCHAQTETYRGKNIKK